MGLGIRLRSPFSKHASPIHPGTGTGQEVHAGNQFARTGRKIPSGNEKSVTLPEGYKPKRLTKAEIDAKVDELIARYKETDPNFRMMPDRGDFTESCGRCDGQGGKSYWPGGTCFECHGAKFVQRRMSTIRERAKREIREGDPVYMEWFKQERRREWERTRQAGTERFLAEHPEFADAMERFGAGEFTPTEDGGGNDFLHSILDQAQRRGELSEAQLNALGPAIERHDRKKAEALLPKPVIPDYPSGRQSVKGKIISYRYEENRFGYGSGSWKMLVELEDGNRAWGTAPGSISSDLERGARVEFDATFERSNDDEHFGFFKRPTKATIDTSAEVEKRLAIADAIRKHYPGRHDQKLHGRRLKMERFPGIDWKAHGVEHPDLPDRPPWSDWSPVMPPDQADEYFERHGLDHIVYGAHATSGIDDIVKDGFLSMYISPYNGWGDGIYMVHEEADDYWETAREYAEGTGTSIRLAMGFENPLEVEAAWPSEEVFEAVWAGGDGFAEFQYAGEGEWPMDHARILEAAGIEIKPEWVIETDGVFNRASDAYPGLTKLLKEAGYDGLIMHAPRNIPPEFFEGTMRWPGDEGKRPEYDEDWVEGLRYRYPDGGYPAPGTGGSQTVAFDPGHVVIIGMTDWTTSGSHRLDRKNPEDARLLELLDVEKHYPGGQDHDQSRHGGDGGYRGSHQPTAFYGAGLHDLSTLVSEDIYDHPEWYFNMRERYNREGASIVQRLRGKPDAPVTIYRAVPKGVTEINPGDWVTTSHEYAQLHGESNMGSVDRNGDWQPGEYDILSREVTAKEVVWPGDSMVEFGWFPDGPLTKDPTLTPDEMEDYDVAKWIGFMKHRPGGVDHDQSKHGNWSEGRDEFKEIQRTALYEMESGSDEQSKELRRYYDMKDKWSDEIEDAISLGHITPEEAEELGYLDDGHGEWAPLPQDLWHATTATSAIRDMGLMDRRAVLASQGKEGLGGGTDTMISFTSDPEVAEDIVFGMREAHDVASGKTDLNDLLQWAKEGHEGSEPFYDEWVGDKDPEWLQGLAEGRERWRGGLSKEPDRAAELILERDPGATDIRPVPSTRTGPGDSGKGAYAAYTYKMGDLARRKATFDMYQMFSAYRERAGGPTDPLFWGMDVDKYASIPKEEISLLQFRAHPGTMGKKLGGLLQEWRTGTGDAVELVEDFQKHYPGGQDHDQSKHGRRGLWRGEDSPKPDVGDVIDFTGKAASRDYDIARRFGGWREKVVYHFPDREGAVGAPHREDMWGDNSQEEEMTVDGKFRVASIEQVGKSPLGAPVWQAELERVQKHYPGGQDHDQSKHGRKGPRKPKTLGIDPHAQGSLFLTQPRLADSLEPPKKEPVEFPTLTPGHFVTDIGTTTEPISPPRSGFADMFDVQSKVGLYETNPDVIDEYTRLVAKDPIEGWRRLGAFHDQLGQDASEASRLARVGKSEQRDLLYTRDLTGMERTVPTDEIDMTAMAAATQKRADAMSALRKIDVDKRAVEDIMRNTAPLAVAAYTERGREIQAEVHQAWEDMETPPFIDDNGRKHMAPISPSTRDTLLDKWDEYVAEHYPELAPEFTKAREMVQATEARRERSNEILDRRQALRTSPLPTDSIEMYAVPRDLISDEGREMPTSTSRYDDFATGSRAGLDYYDANRERTLRTFAAAGELGYIHEHTKLGPGMRDSAPFKAIVLTEEEVEAIRWREATGLKIQNPDNRYSGYGADVSIAQWGENKGKHTMVVRYPGIPAGDGYHLKSRKSVQDLGPLQPIFVRNMGEYADLMVNGDPDTVYLNRRELEQLYYDEAMREQRGVRAQIGKSETLWKDTMAKIRQSTTREQAVIDVLSRHREMGGELLSLSKRRGKAEKNVQLSANAYPTDWIDRSNAKGGLQMQSRKYNRAYYNHNEYGGALIKIDSSNPMADDALHELGHRFEHVIPELTFAESEFYDQRTEGDILQSLNAVTGRSSYGSWEQTKLDVWVSPYMGKKYGGDRVYYSLDERTLTMDKNPKLVRAGFTSSKDAFELFTTGYPYITGRTKLSGDIVAWIDESGRLRDTPTPPKVRKQDGSGEFEVVTDPLHPRMVQRLAAKKYAQGWIEHEAFILGMLAEL